MSRQRRHAVVLRPSELPRVERGGGASTIHLANCTLGADAFTTGITELEPDGAIPLHAHNCDETVLVLEGRLVFDDESGTRELATGDATFVPAHVFHRFANRSAERAKIFWVYGSVTPTRILAATGETRPVLNEATSGT